MVTQQDLRNNGAATRVQRLQQRRQKQLQVESEKEFGRQSELSQTQREKLDLNITNLKADIKRLEVAETRGSMGEALEAASTKQGRKVELTRLQELSGKLGEGQYYTNFEDLLRGAKERGKATASGTQAGFNPAIQAARTPSLDIPKGAKIESIKGGVITYSIPSVTKESVTDQTRIIIGTSPERQAEIDRAREINSYIETEKPKIQSFFAGKVDDSSLGQLYVTPSEVSLPGVGGRKITVPEQTVNVLTSEGTQKVGTGSVDYSPYSILGGQKIYKTVKVDGREIIDYKNIPSQKVEGEIYSSLLGGYVKPTEAGGKEFSKGTAQVRPQTYFEFEQRDIMRGNTARKILGDSKGRNILTEDLEVIKKEQKSVERLSKVLEESSKKNIDAKGEWIGTKEQLEKYNKLIDQYNTLGKREAGLFGLTRKVDLVNFDLQKKPVTSSFNILTTTLSSTAGRGIERGTKDYLGFKESTSKVLGEKVTTVSKFGLDLGKYAIPVAGTGIFAAEAGEFGYDIWGTKRRGEKLTREQKIEGGMLLGAVVLGGVVKQVKTARTTVKPPRKIEIISESKPVRTLKFENRPKLKVIESADGKLSKVIETGGTTKTAREINPIRESISTGKRYVDLQYSDAFGNVAGKTVQKTKWGKFGKDKTIVYEIGPKGMKYDFYRGKKLVKSGKDVPRSSGIVLGDLEKSKWGTVEREILLPDKRKAIVGKSKTVYTQEMKVLGTGKAESVVKVTESSFRSKLRKPLQKKYDDLSGIDKKFWEGQVRADSKTGNIGISKMRDLGYGTLFTGKTPRYNRRLSEVKFSSEKEIKLELPSRKSKYKVLEGEQKTVELVDTRTIIQPAKEFQIGEAKTKELSFELRREAKRIPAKVSKKDVPDVVKLGEQELLGESLSVEGGKVADNILGTPGTLYKTPRFIQSVDQKLTSKGKFVLQKEDNLYKFVEFQKKMFRDKRGSATLAPQIMREKPRVINLNEYEFAQQAPKIDRVILKDGKILTREKSKLDLELFTEVNVPKVNFETPRVTNVYYGPERLNFGDKVNRFNFLVRGDKEREEFVSFTKVKPLTREVNLIKNSQELIQQPKVLEKTKELYFEKPREIFKQAQEPKQQEKLKELLKDFQRQQPKQEQTAKNLLRQELKQGERIEPRKSLRPRFDFGPTPDVDVKEPGKDLLKQFKVFVTKGGRETPLEEEFTTLPQARKGLKKELLGSLRAGGFVEEDGRKLKFEEVGLFGSEFRRSKVDPFKVIQKKEKRLGRKSETKEIQFFRKTKGGSSFL